MIIFLTEPMFSFSGCFSKKASNIFLTRFLPLYFKIAIGHLFYVLRLRVRGDNLTICYRKKQIDVSFSCVCPVLDNEFRHHDIIKVFCSPHGYRLVDPQLL